MVLLFAALGMVGLAEISLRLVVPRVVARRRSSSKSVEPVRPKPDRGWMQLRIDPATGRYDLVPSVDEPPEPWLYRRRRHWL